MSRYQETVVDWKAWTRFRLVLLRLYRCLRWKRNRIREQTLREWPHLGMGLGRWAYQVSHCGHLHRPLLGHSVCSGPQRPPRARRSWWSWTLGWATIEKWCASFHFHCLTGWVSRPFSSYPCHTCSPWIVPCQTCNLTMASRAGLPLSKRLGLSQSYSTFSSQRFYDRCT